MKQQLYLLRERFNRYILENGGVILWSIMQNQKRKERQKEKKKKIENLLQKILQDSSCELEEWEIKILEDEIEKIYVENIEMQKTLKEHEKDIVACAERFFVRYDQYFTEKEKRLIIEACRIHDWGKANLLFQAVVNEEVKEETI